MKTNTFTTHKADKIPPVSKEDGFNKQNNLSDYFFAKVKTIGGDVCKSTVRYDHERKKWLMGRSGVKEVVEYYTFD